MASFILFSELISHILVLFSGEVQKATAVRFALSEVKDHAYLNCRDLFI